jgi:hypothetical protein
MAVLLSGDGEPYAQEEPPKRRGKAPAKDEADA